ncbi:hypothetical protein Tco_0780637 [Tanacetum coccineum]
MSVPKFADSHNMVAFLAKPTESDGFEQILDFLNVKTINREVQLQALVDGNKVIITETSVRRDLKLEDAKGIKCLPNVDIFEQLALMGYEKPSQKLTFYKAFFSPQWKFLIHTILQCLSAKSTAWNEFSSTMSSTIICLATNQKYKFSKYIFESMVKNVDSSVKFIMYLRFVQVFLDKQVGDMSTHDEIFVTPSHTKKVFGNMKRVGKGFSGAVTPLFPTMMVQAQEEMGEEPITDEAANEEKVPTQSNDQLLSRFNTLRSGEDRLTLKELMDLYTKLYYRVLDLETIKTAQAKEIASFKKREDASKQGRKIADIDADAEVTLIDETQERNDDNLMFDTGVLDEQEVEVEKVVNTTKVTTKSATTTTVDKLTMAQTLIEIKAAKPKVRGVMIQELSEFTTTTTTTPAASKPLQDKGKAKMIESEKPLKKKDQIMYDQEVALNLQA